MDILRYMLGLTGLLAGALVILASFVRQIANYRDKGKEGYRWSSPAPFIGPGLIVWGYLVLPIAFCPWVFLAFALDPDTVVTLWSIPCALKASRR